MPLAIDLSGKCAVVTGVGDGIGAGAVRMLARAGASIAGCSLEAAADPAIVRLQADVAAAGGSLTYAQLDVTRAADRTELIQIAARRFNRIDVLVSNAGANLFARAEACSDEAWERNLRLNLSSHWQLAKLSRPFLEASQAGVVEIMCSNHAFATIPGCFPYNVAKAALVGLVRSLAVEWGPAIRVVGIAPGFVDTPGNQRWFESFPNPAAERQRTECRHPARRLGSPDEIGAWCAFLASPYAAFATGITYVVDGGRLALLQDP